MVLVMYDAEAFPKLLERLEKEPLSFRGDSYARIDYLGLQHVMLLRFVQDEIVQANLHWLATDEYEDVSVELLVVLDRVLNDVEENQLV